MLVTSGYFWIIADIILRYTMFYDDYQIVLVHFMIIALKTEKAHPLGGILVRLSDGYNGERNFMNTEQLNQALRLTINELTTQLTNESTTKNLLAIQLTEAEQASQRLNQEKAELQARVTELEALLEEQTQPAEEKGE